MQRIPVSGPSITAKEIAYVTDAVTNAWYGNANMYHERFERAFAEYLGMRHAIALPSCTAAIHLSLLALGVGPGDEVIVPESTWIATSAPITYVGATPIFADIDPQTWCLSARSFESCITPRTKAVIPVDLYGNMPEMAEILDVADRHGVRIIEDAAEAIGSEYQGKKAGSFGITGVFSFHGSKTLTTGEGGILVTDDTDLYHRILTLRDHGRAAGEKLFWNAEVGQKYKMSSMQAALGLAQLERIDELVAHKRQIFAWYEHELSGFDDVVLNYEAPGTKNTYWMVTAIMSPRFGLEKEAIMRELSARSIDPRPFFYPLSSLPAYAQTAQAADARQRNAVAYQISPYGVNLPSGINMTEDSVHYVCDMLKDILSQPEAMPSKEPSPGQAVSR
jgi:perosamine synthetase